jgi:hypothetical protein
MSVTGCPTVGHCNSFSIRRKSYGASTDYPSEKAETLGIKQALGAVFARASSSYPIFVTA